MRSIYAVVFRIRLEGYLKAKQFQRVTWHRISLLFQFVLDFPQKRINARLDVVPFVQLGLDFLPQALVFFLQILDFI
ncbi:protein of unknown function [Pseudodesulfovibrio piezophilus C1TLV30]|uniref:Uncharacterized protein n=1 Tax=Pseudodesulfovibrio piezophilus (strain DSM 21447 / JCM 15486 / C1TLV30) TaxID=1322246 RepID=M1WKL4_PSEP2|nr:protein of unknown function [Pseudodesulfovibrio piezophilus C1TLV30]